MKIIQKKVSMKFLFSNIFLLVFILILSGCSGMNSSFDCNVKSGGRCASMDKINDMANSGVYNQGRYKGTIFARTNQSGGYPLNVFDGAPIRSGESIQQIWIGPYEDEVGNYHEASYVYSVIKQGKWISESASTIQD